eukprot:g8285.t1
MHYVPESACEFLPDDATGGAGSGNSGQSFHHKSAPIYLLTFAVGLLLAADLLIGFVNDDAWNAYRTLAGFRLALLAAVVGGARILYQTLERLFEGTIGADLALTIAALAAIVLGEHTTAALVVFVALCGESIEGYTVDRAQRAIRRIFDLRPSTARVLRDGREFDRPLEEIVVGDRIVIRPGERIPVDGRVIAGTSAVDQSSLTGESLPIDKTTGDEVFTGTLNRYGALTVAAEKVGEQTTLAQVVRLVAEAAEKKAPLERTADRLARMFLPAVLGIALITLIGWRLATGEWSPGFRPMLGVLVVACPCPLILATPTAVMAAMAWLARTGVVVKGSVALERLAHVDTFAFDKTGTLTRGELALGDVVPLANIDGEELLRTAAVAERRSEHLLARLIVREAEAQGSVVPYVEAFTSHPGAGVVAFIPVAQLGPWADDIPLATAVAAESTSPRTSNPTERRVVVGNRRLLETQEIPIDDALETRLTELDRSGQMMMLVACENTVLGILGVRDSVRAESSDVIAELRNEGISEFALLTGDRKHSADSVAGPLGLADNVHADMLPRDKAEWIERESTRGRRIAMVGDGVNDAPALAAAHVGLALGGVGSDIAAEAGDLVLMGDPLRPLPGLLRLSRQMVANIRQSIFVFAFGMNFLGMALCGLNILTPVGGAVFHELASLAVMINAMRLLWFERWDDTRLGRSVRRLGTAAEWITESLSPTRLAFGFIRHGTLLLRLAFAGIALYWFTTGIVRITADEEALVTRFGKYHTNLSPGLHWRWPAPFERIIRKRIGLVRTVQIGFRASGPARVDAELRAGTIEWTSEHSETGYQPRPDEALILTGDEVPVELTAEVHYRISDLYQYVYGGNRPDATIRTVAESVLRDVAARTSLDELLTIGREQFRQRCLQQIQRRLQTYGIGVAATDLQLLDIHPPKAVVPAYRDVADAMEEKERSINEARAYYASKVLSAAGERGMQFLKRVDALHGVAGCGAHVLLDETRWNEVWSELARATEIDGEQFRGNLSGAAAADLHAADQSADRQIREAEADRDRFLSLWSVYNVDGARQVTRRELYWKMLTDVLPARPLTIIDPRVTGRTHLLLMTPDQINGIPALRDKNILNVKFGIQYRISEEQIDAYLFGTTDPERRLQVTAEGVLSSLVTQSGVDFMHTHGRAQLQQLFTERLRALCERQRFGIAVDTVTLEKIEPPLRVRAAFLDVNDARADKQKYVNSAAAYAAERREAARADVQEIRNEAEVYRQQTIEQAKAEAESFVKLVEQFEQIASEPGGKRAAARKIAMQRFYLDTMQSILRRVKGKVILESGKPIDLTIMRNPRE